MTVKISVAVSAGKRTETNVTAVANSVNKKEIRLKNDKMISNIEIALKIEEYILSYISQMEEK